MVWLVMVTVTVTVTVMYDGLAIRRNCRRFIQNNIVTVTN